jgi:hypothetical protein
MGLSASNDCSTSITAASTPIDRYIADRYMDRVWQGLDGDTCLARFNRELKRWSMDSKVFCHRRACQQQVHPNRRLVLDVDVRPGFAAVRRVKIDSCDSRCRSAVPPAVSMATHCPACCLRPPAGLPRRIWGSRLDSTGCCVASPAPRL